MKGNEYRMGILALLFTSACISLAPAEPPVEKEAGQLLYNGIQLPKQWPPRLERLSREPMPVPYLEQPPEVIPIDLGRQLFVDDFLIERTTLSRAFHRARYHPANPVLEADKPWEQQGRAPCAMPFSDGVWYDPQEKLFKMWYMGGYVQSTCYATSKDGVHWQKPELDVEPGTNVVLREERDSSTVWIDHRETDPKKRYKMFTAVRSDGPGGWTLTYRVSADGVHWSKRIASAPGVGDRTTVFFNPFRSVWVLSRRIFVGGRSRAYREHPDPVACLGENGEGQSLWVGADRLDPHHPKPEFSGNQPQLYNLDAVAYESLLLGLFSVWQGPHNGECARLGIQKRNEVLLGFSRDGFHWHRPDRRPFIGANPTVGAWNWGNVQSAGGGCLVVGDKLYFYVSGRAINDKFWDGDCSTGLAVLRRDGFASMDAGDREGVLTTRPVRFGGKHLTVNVAAAEGELRAEVLDRAGQVIQPFTRANCLPVRADKTLVAVKFNGADDLSTLAGRPVRLRFFLRKGSLYSFWLSPDGSGASGGYVAGGGPGLNGPTDTVGSGAYAATGRLAR